MFTKIVSQLSLSPSAGSQLAFYARRLGQERITRTLSALAAVLVIGLQFATIAAPPTSANAASPNDIIYGGVVSLNDLLNEYDDNAQLRAIYGHWGVTRADIAAAKETTINSKDHSLKSLGRIQHLASDAPIDIDGVTYYQRGLYTWDTGANVATGSSYKVFAGTRSGDGGYFAIMLACGNIVVKTNLTPPPPPPPPKPTPKPTPKPSPTPTPKTPIVSCVDLEGTTSSGPAPVTVNFTGQGQASGETITGYEFNYGDSSPTLTSATPTAVHTYKSPGVYTAYMLVKSSLGSVTSKSTACSFPVTVSAIPAAFTKHKSALNLTQNIDATQHLANAGDQIRYILTTTNIGGMPSNYVVTEHLESVLQYANVTDNGGGQLNDGVMSWPVTVIEPGQTITNTFTVTVMNPIPTTPVGTSDKFSYDLKMDNVYGNAIQVGLQPPLPKQIELASASLPDTGASTGTVVVLIVGILTLFMYFRNRQLITEIKLLRGEYQGGGL
jgi:PKD repeat protein